MTLVVAHCIPRYAKIDSDAAACAEALAWGWKKHAPAGWLLKRNEMQGQPVQHVRNLLVEWALADQGDVDPETRVGDAKGPAADVILWQDSDVSFDPDEALRLVETLARADAGVGAVGAPCIVQSREGPARTNVNLNGFEDSLELVMQGKCAEVAQVGFGLIACRASVYRALGFPWHSFGYGGSIDRVIGEDGGWCDAARLAGFAIFAHGDVRPWHTFSRRFRLDREAEGWLALSGGRPPAPSATGPAGPLPAAPVTKET
jgi:hypothetical protein